MHRILWLKIGGRRLHLLKTAGAFFMFFSVLMLASALYHVFVTVEMARAAFVRPELVGQLFGWSIESNSIVMLFTNEDFLGVLLAPVAWVLFWFAISILSIIVYQSGKVVVPIEEYEQKITEHHRELIRKAIEHAKKKKR